MQWLRILFITFVIGCGSTDQVNVRAKDELAFSEDFVVSGPGAWEVHDRAVRRRKELVELWGPAEQEITVIRINPKSLRSITWPGEGNLMWIDSIDSLDHELVHTILDPLLSSFIHEGAATQHEAGWRLERLKEIERSWLVIGFPDAQATFALGKLNTQEEYATAWSITKFLLTKMSRKKFLMLKELPDIQEQWEDHVRQRAVRAR